MLSNNDAARAFGRVAVACDYHCEQPTASGDRSLMAKSTRSCIKERAKSLFNFGFFLEGGFKSHEISLRKKAIRPVIKCRCCFGRRMELIQVDICFLIAWSESGNKDEVAR